MTSLSRSLRARVHELDLTDVDTTDMLRVADQLQFLEEKERQAHQSEAILHAVTDLRDAFWQFRQQNDQRQDALYHAIQQLREKIIMLDKDVQAAVDQIALNTSAEASATAALTLLVTQVADLQAALAAMPPPGAPVDAENRAAILAMTESLKGTLSALTTAIPANVPPVTTPPVFVPDPVLVQAAADALAASDAAAAAAAASPNDPVLAQAAIDAKAKSDAAALAAADPNAAGTGTLTMAAARRR
jgi:hypothetical protein